MVIKRINHARIIIFVVISSMMMILIALLWSEYRFFCHQAQTLIVLREKYRMHLQVVKHFLDTASVPSTEKKNFDEELFFKLKDSSLTEQVDAVFDDNSVDSEHGESDMFVILNRQPEYLKQSTLEYLESQELDSLLTRIDVDEWQDYTEHVIMAASKPKQIVAKQNTKLRKKNKPIIPKNKRAWGLGLIWPINKSNFWLSSLFGPRKKGNGSWGFHYGIDMAAVKGKPVKAVQDGVVIEARYAPGYGNTVVIKHNQVFKTRYAHLHTIKVRGGQKVKQGAIVGTVGETGFIRKKGKDGSHLHFEVYENNKKVNPLHCLPTMS